MTEARGPNGKARAETAVDVLDRLAVELDGVQRKAAGDAVEYSLSGLVFASREEGRLSFRLRPEVVAAALRTPDTVRSSRGEQWIMLATGVADAFTLDRARSWFESAWRLAGEVNPGRTTLH